jgi:hypothetical protein
VCDGDEECIHEFEFVGGELRAPQHVISQNRELVEPQQLVVGYRLAKMIDSILQGCNDDGRLGRKQCLAGRPRPSCAA